LAPLIKRLREKKVGSVIVTNSDGALIGILYRKVHSRYTCETCRHTFRAAEEFEAHNFKIHPELNKFPR